MYFWTSEAVSKGHPDKVADQIADAVLDAYMEVDPLERVACEVTCCQEMVLITGEVSSEKKVDIEGIARKKICEIGYDRPESCYDGNTIPILNLLHAQSKQIAHAVAKDDGEIGAGDQGIMFGYACDETPNYMPLAHVLAFEVIGLLEKNRGDLLLPDAKSQITLAYEEEGRPSYIDTILVSTQHQEWVKRKDLDDYLDHLIKPYFLEKYAKFIHPDKTKWLFNPAGLWTFGGPSADSSLTGRKIVVDQYGPSCPIGGGSFSGKDCTKVDRSGAYAVRHIAKNIVAAGLAQRCQIQVSYAIGVVEPVSLRIQTFGTGRDDELTQAVKKLVSLTPKAIIDRFNLRQPIYAVTASGGHFGREPDGIYFPWERLDLVDKLSKSF